MSFLSDSSNHLHLSKKLTNNQNMILTHPVFFQHIISNDHPEKPERIEYILNQLKLANLDKLVEQIDTKRNVDAWILKIHTKKHVNSLKMNSLILSLLSYFESFSSTASLIFLGRYLTSFHGSSQHQVSPGMMPNF